MAKIFPRTLTAIIIVLFITACNSPQSKETYLNGYENFILEVQKKASSYTDEEWVEIDKKFELYSTEWLTKFEDDLTWKEQLLITKYSIQYNIYKSKGDIGTFYDLFIKDDLHTIKHQLEEYAENDMEEDIRFVVQQAQEIGDEAIKALEEIMKELELNIKDYK